MPILANMNDSPMFVAVLLHDRKQDQDRVVELPRLEQVPPSEVRMPTNFEGAAAWDVYKLVGTQEWPDQAVYQHVSVDPSTQQM